MSILALCLLLQIPYPDQPDWESTGNDYSTGGALVDINLDCGLDLLTGNGNDMAQQANRVHYHNGSELETSASWSSSDIGYNAHISVCDINGDGYPDLAVAGYGDPGTPQYDKFYYNMSGTLQPSSAWQPAHLDNSFGCAFGDIDGDGDADLAVACGEEYTHSLQPAKVYLNENGILDTAAVWQSDVASYFYDAAWVDIDNDGDLDLVLAGHHRKNLIYRNIGGMLDTTPCWQSANSLGTLKIAFGDIDNDGDLDMVCANNAQTGGTSNCELYLNNGSTLDTQPVWTSPSLNYYSCVALGDVDRDGDLDLAAGGWWESIKIFENVSGILASNPSWQWAPPIVSQLVCENICFGDIDNTLNAVVTDEPHVVGPSARVFYLEHRWLKSITAIKRSSGSLTPDQYTFSFADGWVSVGDLFPQAETLWVDYTYSLDLDLVVTNWYPNRGNFAFYNTLGTGTRELVQTGATGTLLFPNPSHGRFTLRLDAADPVIRLFDAGGRLVAEQRDGRIVIELPGVYFMLVYDGATLIAREKVVVVD